MAPRLTFSATLAVLLVTGGLTPSVWALCEIPTADRPKIGLVLGGGGARGSAHIGVIRVLEEMNIPVDYVAGTSIGSLVGALFATGMTADELEKVMLDIDWNELFNDETERKDQPFRRKLDDNLALFLPKLGIGEDSSLLPTGAIAGQKISFLFETLTKQRINAADFDDLPIPFRAVAADIATGEQVVLEHGDLALAMRSSMSVPGVFDPVVIGEHLLVDGGIVNNVPVDVVRAMGADVLIVVDVGSGIAGKDELNNALAILGQMTSLMIKYNTDAQLKTLTDSDVLIMPALGDDVSSADFGKTAEGIKIGYTAADAARATLASLSVPYHDYQAYRSAVASCVTPMPPVQFVRVDNRSRFDDSVIQERVTIKAGAPLDIAELEDNIKQIYALGFIELARYEMVQEEGRNGVVIQVDQDSRGEHFIELGLDYYGDFDDSALNLRVGYLDTAVDEFGSELRAIAQLGEDPAFAVDLYKYLHPRLKFYIEPRIVAERREVLSYDADGHLVLKSQVTQYGGSFAVGRELGRHASVSIGLRAFRGDVDTKLGSVAVNDFHYQGGEYFVSAILDRMDDRYFPGQGSLINLMVRSSEEGLGADDEYRQLQLDAIVARTFDRHSVLAGGRYYETFDDIAPIYRQFRAGGFTRLSGLNEEELAGQNFAMALAGYRYHFAGSGFMPAYLGMTAEYGQVAEDASDLFDDAIFAGSLYFGYRSPIGPLYLGVGLAEGGQQSYFLRVGDVFGRSTIGQ